MNKRSRYLLLYFLCTISFSVTKAQTIDTLPSVIIHDSIYQTNVTSAEDYEFREPGTNNRVDARKVPGEKVRKLKSDRNYWYVDQTPSGERESPPPGVNEKGKKERQERIKKSREINFPSWVRALFWIILIGGFVALLIGFLATSDIRLFREKPRPVEEQIEEKPTDNIFEMNFETEIAKAIETKNYRLAVRLMYLRTLRDLTNRNLINYAHEKTNSDYLFQLGGTPYYKNFFKLTRSFDYTWYGHFELSQDVFAMIQNDFSSFKRQLS
jgi:hypothetical protein